jgi:hypothetical protein
MMQFANGVEKIIAAKLLLRNREVELLDPQPWRVSNNRFVLEIRNMKRLLILTVGAMTLFPSAGCQNPFRRNTVCQPACAPVATYAAPSDGCGTTGAVQVIPGGTVTGPAIVPVPGPEVYTPATR